MAIHEHIGADDDDSLEDLIRSSGEDYYEQVALPDDPHITLNVLHTLDQR